MAIGLTGIPKLRPHPDCESDVTISVTHLLQNQQCHDKMDKWTGPAPAWPPLITNTTPFAPNHIWPDKVHNLFIT